MLGFIIAAAAILMTVETPGSVLAEIKGKPAHKDLWQTFVVGMHVLAAGTAASLAALLVQLDTAVGDAVEATACGLLLLSMLQVLRCTTRLTRAIQLRMR